VNQSLINEFLDYHFLIVLQSPPVKSEETTCLDDHMARLERLASMEEIQDYLRQQEIEVDVDLNNNR
jgi:hypothetical protein